MTHLPPAAAVRPLYEGGPQVSGIGWGMWRFSGDDVAAAEARVVAALDAGVTLFDTADIYGPDNNEPFGAAEALLGRVFQRNRGLAQRMVIATKGSIVIGTPYDSSRAYLTSAIDASLARMGVEHVALWQIHRPDILTHPSEIAEALTAAHKAGKIGAIGVSNFTASQVEALAAYLDLPVVSNQIELSPLEITPFTNGLTDQALARRMTVMAWSPLGGGRLFGEDSEQARRARETLTKIGAELGGALLDQVALAWILRH
ncbi:MAG TPA: aldo/keto reductase, partial [Phenylobacterium sp.]|nr:aldo/keto reductase [Phenylobacterium sp.]